MKQTFFFILYVTNSKNQDILINTIKLIQKIFHDFSLSFKTAKYLKQKFMHFLNHSIDCNQVTFHSQFTIYFLPLQYHIYPMIHQIQSHDHLVVVLLH